MYEYPMGCTELVIKGYDTLKICLGPNSGAFLPDFFKTEKLQFSMKIRFKTFCSCYINGIIVALNKLS